MLSPQVVVGSPYELLPKKECPKIWGQINWEAFSEKRFLFREWGTRVKREVSQNLPLGPFFPEVGTPFSPFWERNFQI